MAQSLRRRSAYWNAGVCLPVGARILFLVQNVSATHAAAYQIGVCQLGVMRQERKASHIHLVYRPRIVGLYPFSPVYLIRLIKRGGNFAF
jgi:hypothetical protein